MVSFESDREIEIVLERAPTRRRPRTGRRPATRDQPAKKRIITDSPYD